MTLKLFLTAAICGLTSLTATTLLAKDASPTARAEGYSAVKDILHDEARADGILKIKHPQKGVEEFIKQVAAVSKEYDEKLDAWVKEEPSLIAKRDGFPPIETKTRGDIHSSQTKSLLLSGGKNFEIRMLVAQVQATDYLSHAFGVLADSEKSDARKENLKEAKEKYEKLNGEAYVLLGAKK